MPALHMLLPSRGAFPKHGHLGGRRGRPTFLSLSSTYASKESSEACLPHPQLHFLGQGGGGGWLWDRPLQPPIFTTLWCGGGWSLLITWLFCLL